MLAASFGSVRVSAKRGILSERRLEEAALHPPAASLPPGDSKCLLDLLGRDGAAVEESALLKKMNQIVGAVLFRVGRGLLMGLVYSSVRV